MRIKDKIFCDYCGKFLFKLKKSEYEMINKERREGTLISLGSICKKCAKIVLKERKKTK